jgi:hypothetical protein
LTINCVLPLQKIKKEREKEWSYIVFATVSPNFNIKLIQINNGH